MDSGPQERGHGTPFGLPSLLAPTEDPSGWRGTAAARGGAGQGRSITAEHPERGGGEAGLAHCISAPSQTRFQNTKF